MRSHRRVRGSAIALLLLSIGLIPAGPAAASGTVSCSKTDDTLVTHMTGDSVATIRRNDAGAIFVNDQRCGNATVTNINNVRFLGDAGPQEIVIQIGHGRFKPGLTGEVGSSDEIEFFLFLGSGSNDALTITGSADVDNIRLGYKQTNLGYFPRVNLNAGEATGIDADVFGTNDLGIKVNANAGADIVSAGGGAGTGDVYPLGFKAHGGAGGDTITGGNAPTGDYLLGDDGPDTLNGGLGNDDLEAGDGVSGNDTMNGGPGTNDYCDGDPGDTKTGCEVG